MTDDEIIALAKLDGLRSTGGARPRIAKGHRLFLSNTETWVDVGVNTELQTEEIEHFILHADKYPTWQRTVLAALK